MALNRNKLYSIIFIACMAGYIWLYFSQSKLLTGTKPVEVCLIKHVTNIPCPSCGSTRAVISLSNGNVIEALKINPMGFIVAIIMLLAPLWIIFDIAARRNTLFVFYQKTETYLKKPRYAIPLVLLVLINWVWNFTKGL
jgi:hypothetical protein